MIASVIVAVLLAQTNVPGGPAPTPTPIVTTLLTFKMPTHGYHLRSAVEIGTVKYSIDALVDGFGNRDVNATFTAAGRTTRSEYLIMDGLSYIKSGASWMPSPIDRTVAVVLQTGTYPAPATFAPPRTVSDQGMGPCGAGTCKLFLASGTTKLNEQPMVSLWHLAVDPQRSYLSNLSSAIVRTDGSTFVKMDEQFDRFDGVQLSVPDIASAAATSQCQKANATIGALEVCVVKGMFAEDVYTLRVGGTLALRAGETVADSGASSPVMEGISLRCSPVRKSQSVDPNLEATLKRSGMSDDQIAATIGQRLISADCSVLSQAQPVATVHFDFK